MGAPIRTCVACRQKRPQSELIRVTWDSKAVTADLPQEPGAGRGSGRGAYVCRTSNCVEASVRGPLDRALRADGARMDGLMEEMLEMLGAAGQER